MDVFLYSNKGGRKHNEDSAGYELYEDRSIFAAADGLGGHQQGALASQCAVRMLLNAWKEDSSVQEEPEKWLEDQISIVNDSILKLQEEHQCTMKTTLVTLLLNEQKAVWAHIGDSRLYYFHNKTLEYVTEDHSVAYKKYKAGEITRQQISIDEDQSCLLRSLGSESRYEPDIHILDRKVESGDAFLLCTDGAWEYLRDEELLFDLLKAKNARDWTELLMLRVMDRIPDDNDNLTILAIVME